MITIPDWNTRIPLDKPPLFLAQYGHSIGGIVMKLQNRQHHAAGWALAMTVCLCAMAGPAAALAGEEPAGEVVYKSNFSELQDHRWSEPRTEKEPNSEAWCLGHFGETSVTLTIDNLPEHRFVRLRLDLLLTNLWSGSQTSQGPDRMIIRVKDGPVLLDSTFSTHSSMDQSYPDRTSTAFHQGLTGASASQQNARDGGIFGVFPLSFYIPHEGDAIQIEFEGDIEALDQRRGNVVIAGVLANQQKTENWALNNVIVETFKVAPIRLTREDVRGALFDLASSDTARVTRGVEQLIGGGDLAISLIRSLPPFTPQEDLPERLVVLIETLNSQEKEVQEDAIEAIERLGVEAVPLLEKRLSKRLSLSQWMGVHQALYDLRAPGSYLFEERLAHVLTVAGTPSASSLLEELPASARDNVQRVKVMENRGLLMAVRHMEKNNQRLIMHFTFKAKSGQPLAEDTLTLRWRGGQQTIHTDVNGVVRIPITSEMTDDAIIEVGADVDVTSRTHVELINQEQQRFNFELHQPEQQAVPGRRGGILIR